MKATQDSPYNADDPIGQLTRDALNPNMGDGKLYALDVPSSTGDLPVPLAPPHADAYVAAFDPNNKTTYSVNGVSNLYKVSTDYGFRAGVTDVSPLLPNGAPSAVVPPLDATTAPRPSNLIKFAVIGALAYYGYKHFLKKSRG